jgi:hypothetical protein
MRGMQRPAIVPAPGNCQENYTPRVQSHALGVRFMFFSRTSKWVVMAAEASVDERITGA